MAGYLTPTEKAAYDLQLTEQRDSPLANCSSCMHGDRIGWKVYGCKRLPDVYSAESMRRTMRTMRGDICFKWRNKE